MADFTAITTQEQFDAIIGERLKREKETYSKKYSDYDDLKSQVDNLTKNNAALDKSLSEATKSIDASKITIDELTDKCKKYETDSVKTRIARKHGLDYDLASRLNGSTEEEIEADATTLSELLKTSKPEAPLASPETDVTKGDEKNAAYKEMLHKMKGE
mgnify:CR=1 FL=1|jgi:predicted nuclease with TOPRIM domain